MTKKSPEIESFLNELEPDRKEALKGNFCVICKKPIVGFRDSLSEHEWTISGMCQACQDDFFNGD